MDATVGEQWLSSPQIVNFPSFSGGDRITIVRPTQLGGSYPKDWCCRNETCEEL